MEFLVAWFERAPPQRGSSETKRRKEGHACSFKFQSGAFGLVGRVPLGWVWHLATFRRPVGDHR